jgi:hypothetical protein
MEIVKANNCEIITNNENFELIEKIVMDCALIDNNNDKIYDLLLVIYDVKTTENINLISNIEIILNDNLFQFKMNKNDGYKIKLKFSKQSCIENNIFIINSNKFIDIRNNNIIKIKLDEIHNNIKLDY